MRWDGWQGFAGYHKLPPPAANEDHRITAKNVSSFSSVFASHHRIIVIILQLNMQVAMQATFFRFHEGQTQQLL